MSGKKYYCIYIYIVYIHIYPFFCWWIPAARSQKLRSQATLPAPEPAWPHPPGHPMDVTTVICGCNHGIMMGKPTNIFLNIFWIQWILRENLHRKASNSQKRIPAHFPTIQFWDVIYPWWSMPSRIQSKDMYQPPFKGHPEDQIQQNPRIQFRWNG